MRKFKHFVDLDKEEAWLRAMSAQGFNLQHKGLFGYQFSESEHVERIYRIDYRPNMSREDYSDYVMLFNDAGWELIDGSRSSGYQYFASTDRAYDSDIFSDQTSKTMRYRRLFEMWGSLFFIYLALFIVLVLTNDSFSFQAILDPASLYYTPGLWDKQGTDFVFAFLFETPFALGRGFFWIFLLVFIIISGYYGIRSWQLGRKK